MAALTSSSTVTPFSQSKVEGITCQTAIIVNADDLGYAPWIDSGIFEAFHNGIVSCASLLVNGASAVAAAKRAGAEGLPIGLHLNLSEGLPVSSPETVQSLLSPEGRFLYKEKFWHAAEEAFRKKDLCSASLFERHVAIETRAQLARFRELTGHFATHVDGHQHIHIAPGVAHILAPIFQSEGVISTRIPDESVSAMTWVKPAQRQRWAARIPSARKSREIYNAHGIFAPDRFLGQSFSGGHMTRERVLSCIRRQLPLNRVSSQSSQYNYDVINAEAKKNRCNFLEHTVDSLISMTAEIMVHPGGNASDKLRKDKTLGGCGDGVVDAFSLSEDRQHECAVLCDPELSIQIADVDHRVKIISWEDFHNLVQNQDTYLIIEKGLNDIKRPNVLVLTLGMTASGNHITGRRIRRALTEQCGCSVSMINADSATTESINETIIRNSIDIVIGLHAYHSGRLLFPSNRREDGQKSAKKEGANTRLPIPVVLVAGGTDMNGDVSQKTSSALASQTERQRVIAQSLLLADAVVFFNLPLLKRAESLLCTQCTQSPSSDQEFRTKSTQDLSRVSSRFFVIPQAVDVGHIGHKWLRAHLGISQTDMLLLLPSGIRAVKDPLFLLPQYQIWNNRMTERSPVGTFTSWLVIIGQPRDAATLAKVYEIMPNENIETGGRTGPHGLVYLPPVGHSALLAALSEADIVLNSSLTEGQCGALLEAMALKIPVLARRNEGNCDLLDASEKRGGLFSSAEECFEYIEREWFSHDNDTNSPNIHAPSVFVEDKVNAAAKFVNDCHSFQYEASRYKDVITEVCKRGSLKMTD